MTKFIDCSEGPKETKETVFTHYLTTYKGYEKTESKPIIFDKVVYLGKCKLDGDMFACYNKSGGIFVYKGTKGNEF